MVLAYFFLSHTFLTYVIVFHYLYIYIYIFIYIVGPLSLEVHYLSIYWACGLSREQRSARGGEVFVEEIALINKRWGLVVIAPENVPRMKTSSARLGRGPGRWFDNKDDNLGNSVGADKHCRVIR